MKQSKSDLSRIEKLALWNALPRKIKIKAIALRTYRRAHRKPRHDYEKIAKSKLGNISFIVDPEFSAKKTAEDRVAIDRLTVKAFFENHKRLPWNPWNSDSKSYNERTVYWAYRRLVKNGACDKSWQNLPTAKEAERDRVLAEYVNNVQLHIDSTGRLPSSKYEPLLYRKLQSLRVAGLVKSEWDLMPNKKHLNYQKKRQAAISLVQSYINRTGELPNSIASSNEEERLAHRRLHFLIRKGLFKPEWEKYKRKRKRHLDISDDDYIRVALSGESGRTLAKKYATSDGTISLIKNAKKHHRARWDRLGLWEITGKRRPKS